MAIRIGFIDHSSQPANKVRGIGRYIEQLTSTFPEWKRLSSSTSDSSINVCINPFFQFTSLPGTMRHASSHRSITVIHDLIPLKYPRHFPLGLRGNIKKFINTILLRHYSLIVTDSVASKEDIVNLLHIDPKNIEVVYPYATEPTPPTSVFVPKEYVLYVGDASWNKNLVQIAQAVIRANIPCVFTGKVFSINARATPHPEQKEYAEFLEIAHKHRDIFILKGFVTDAQLSFLYAHALCTLLISRDEGFGYPYVESALVRTPTLLNNIPVFRELSSGAAQFCDASDLASVIDAITQLRKNPAIRSRLGMQAFQRVSTMFTQEQFKKKWLQVIDRVLSK